MSMSRLRDIRARMGWPQDRFATLLGVAQSTLAGYETGKDAPRPVLHLLDILERDITSGVDVTAEGYRIGFPAEAGEGLTGFDDTSAPDAPPGGIAP
jgi:transcriptional regulator with XRE-family HTH domain